VALAFLMGAALALLVYTDPLAPVLGGRPSTRGSDAATGSVAAIDEARGLMGFSISSTEPRLAAQPVATTSTATTSATTALPPTGVNSGTTPSPLTNTSTSIAFPEVGRLSLFCFSLVLPGVRQAALVKWQFEHNLGPFACDRSLVYATSDAGRRLRAELGMDRLRPAAARCDDDCASEGGGQLRTKAFALLWRQVVQEGEFRSAAWSVKVDPDCVFFPARLRSLLSGPRHAEPASGSGMFLLSCMRRHALEGPLQVLSRDAVALYGRSAERCGELQKKHPRRPDAYMHECLLRLGASEREAWSLLSSSGCLGEAGGVNCGGTLVSYHPLPTVAAYRDCMNESSEAARFAPLG